MTENQVKQIGDNTIFGESLYNYYKFISWARWYPDLFLDLLKPETGGINLHIDQRVFLRADVRFFSMYGTFSRGYAKTYNEVLALWVVAILFPGIELAISAQTKENAADLLEAKSNEILKHFPLLKNELKCDPRFAKGFALLQFKNESTIDILANAQTSKGQRRRRLKIEESALLNNALFEDALEPVVEVPRYTIGKLGISDPQELNQQIHFFTTSGFRGSDEYQRSIDMYEDMINLKGKIVLGSSWMLPCYYGRGSNKSKILQKKKTSSPIAFAQNYEQEWVGSSDGALVNINKLMECRVLNKPLMEAEHKDDEYYIGVDVARSQNSNNNQSSVCVGKIVRNLNTGKLISVDVVNLLNISNTLNFSAQALIIKKLKKYYNAKMVITDGNGLGSGLVDEFLKCGIDPITGEDLGCWNTVNTDNEPEISNAEKCLYDLKAQGIQTKIITTFIDMVESGKLHLLEKRTNVDFSTVDDKDITSKVLPFFQTDLLFEEVSNLKLKSLPSGALTVEKVVKKVNKDRFSCLSYMLWYINEVEKEMMVKNGDNSLDKFVDHFNQKSNIMQNTRNTYKKIFR